MNERRKNILLIVPGLSDSNIFLEFQAKNLSRRGLEVQIHTAPWEERAEPLKPKLDRLLKKVDDLTKNGYEVSLLGISAGSSFVINAFCEKPDQIKYVISVCGRLTEGRKVIPSLALATRNYLAFRESVLQCESHLPLLTDENKSKILILRAWRDELVPSSTSKVSGIQTITMPIILHQPGITLALTGYSGKILDFIAKN